MPLTYLWLYIFPWRAVRGCWRRGGRGIYADMPAYDACTTYRRYAPLFLATYCAAAMLFKPAVYTAQTRYIRVAVVRRATRSALPFQPPAATYTYNAFS